MRNKAPNPTTSSVFIFDGMSLAHTAFHAYHKLSFKGKSTSMIYGVPEIIRAFLFRYRTDEAIVVWDGDRDPKRKELLPTYKSHRDKKRDPKERKRFVNQIKKLRKILYALGIPQVINKNIEGDDMIYLLKDRLRRSDKGKLIRIVSGDKDMFQLIEEKTWIYTPSVEKGAIHTLDLFKAHTSLESPQQHVDFLILDGDKSDDIPGYSGIGPVKAKQFLNQFGSISSFLADKKKRHKFIKRKRLRKLYKRNRMLIDLKHFCKMQGYGDKDITFYKGKRSPIFRLPLLIRLADKYGCRRFRLPQFHKPFQHLL